MKASHHHLEGKLTQQELRKLSLSLGVKVNLHISHLLSELFIVRVRRLLKGLGRGTVRRNSLMVGIKGIRAAKHHMGECGNLPQLRKPPQQTYSISILQSISHAPQVWKQQPKYLQRRWLCLPQPSNIKVHFHPTHPAKEKGGQVLLASSPNDDWFGPTVLEDCLALIFCYSVNFSCWLHIWHFIGSSFLNVKWNFFFILKFDFVRYDLNLTLLTLSLWSAHAWSTEAQHV